uniref:C2H2-type domain-containing protein n=1 Tax=Kalanchoe fedtschenkoi TaxID=63787 RepID=A0A7N0UJG4_KALFE
MLDPQASNNNNTAASTSSFQNGLSSSKRKRRPAGTPDAEVVALSPKTLLESDRYVCEICNQGFQRDQNLQMHRRRHKVPWKLVRREDSNKNGSGSNQEAKKRVYVCPEPSCLHHDASHALGDLVGIKKHFRRKHSNYKQWVCDKCCKGYAVQSDYKAHLKTCGTRGHSCDCGRVFSRVESFIEHQDACTIKRVDPPQHQLQLPAAAFQPACSSSTSPSGCGETAGLAMSHFQRVMQQAPKAIQQQEPSRSHYLKQHNLLELQLLPSSSNTMTSPDNDKNETTLLRLSVGTFGGGGGQPRCEEEATILRVAVAEKEYAEEVRRRSKRELELAELEFENAKRIRQQALGELERAKALRDEAVKKISSTIMEITCQACQQQFQTSNVVAAPPLLPLAEESSLAVSFMSSAASEGDGGGGHQI